MGVDPALSLNETNKTCEHAQWHQASIKTLHRVLMQLSHDCVYRVRIEHVNHCQDV